MTAADLATGNARAGRRYFESNCTACHSAEGDLRGIAARLQGLPLLQQMLYPRQGRGGGSLRSQVLATIETDDGETISGPLIYQDEFTIAVRDADGRYRSFSTRAIEFRIDDPLTAHREQLVRYTDQDMHDVLAYLYTLDQEP